MPALTENLAGAPSAEAGHGDAYPANVAAAVVAQANARRLTPEQLRAAANVLARIHSHPKRSEHVR